MFRPISVLCALAAVLPACSSSSRDAAPEPLILQVPTIELAAHEERDDTCFSYRLENDEPLFVSTVEMTAGPGWHHSNWYFVPEEFMDGPDGFWSCDERDFDIVTPLLAGGLLFGQSVQVREDIQQFADGAVIEIPPHSKIIAELHLLNAADTPVTTDYELRVTDVDEAEAEIRLRPFGLVYRDLELGPQRKSSVGAECDLASSIGAPADFSFYYVMPHFHELGLGASLEVIGGPHDGEAILSMEGQVGNSLGQTLTPPFALEGATGLRFSCEFANPRAETVHFGVGDQEMCLIAGFVDSSFTITGGVFDDDEVVAEGAVEERSGPCDVAAFL